MKENITDILIVGAGPTGLTLACALARKGVKCRIVDKRDSFSLIPRAINISNPTLNIFSILGVNDEFWNEGLKLHELTAYWNKKRFLNINYKYIKASHPYFFHLEQNRVESYLNELLQSLNIKVEREISLENISQDGNQVVASLKNKNGREINENYSYVIGCDGGNSTVRKLLDISCMQKNYSSYFILMDAEIEHRFSEQKLHYFICDAGYLIMVPLPHNKYRLIASFKGEYPGNDQVNLSKDFFQKIVNERGPGHVHIIKINWATSSSFYHKLANHAQRGRVFLAGDALHQFTPVGGANMNTGIQDAFDIAEMMVLVKNGIHEKRFFKNYGLQRLIIAKRTLDLTATATGLLTRSISLPNEERKYLPIMKNRQFLKSSLPKLFSGIALMESE